MWLLAYAQIVSCKQIYHHIWSSLIVGKKNEPTVVIELKLLMHKSKTTQHVSEKYICIQISFSSRKVSHMPYNTINHNEGILNTGIYCCFLTARFTWLKSHKAVCRGWKMCIVALDVKPRLWDICILASASDWASCSCTWWERLGSLSPIENHMIS